MDLPIMYNQKVSKKKIIEGQALKSHNKIEHKIDEEVKVEQAISRLEQSTPGEIDLTNEVQSAPIRSFEEEIPEENMREDLIKSQGIIRIDIIILINIIHLHQEGMIIHQRVIINQNILKNIHWMKLRYT